MGASPSAPAIVWFRNDLRLADNPALSAASRSGRPVLCVYVHDEEGEDLRPLGGAARWWLHGSLSALDRALGDLGGGLHIARGRAEEVIDALVRETGAEEVFWNRRYDAGGRAVDERVPATLEARGVAVESFNGHLLREPGDVMSAAGEPYRVFTAYWRAASRLDAPPDPAPAPASLTFCEPASGPLPGCVALDDLALEPSSPDWAGGLRATWERGEAAAQARLEAFLGDGLRGYAENRDRPDRRGTSRLSPHLRFGEISARQVWHAACAAVASGEAEASARDLDAFSNELGWREFCYQLLFHKPDLARENVRAEFDGMPWRTDARGLEAWRRGRTGYPIVDAGMRELWTTGFMHNRVRMIVASFLTKHLLVDWREGEAWFWDTLVDADLANNAANWQWVAGSGADAAPYFRIFNPTLQGEKFDPDGGYVKTWVPELSRLPASVLHRPWAASDAQRADAGVVLGEDYPRPIVDHGEARARALRAWRSIRGA